MSVEAKKLVLKPEAVNLAENARRYKKSLKNALTIAATGLGLPNNHITAEEISELVKNPFSLSVLACLAAIHVDVAKTLANSSPIKFQAINYLDQASKTIRLVWDNPEFMAGVKDLMVDFANRPNPFWAEAKRHIAKTDFAMASISDIKNSELLTVSGEQVLQSAYDFLPEDHQSRPLIGIEVQLSRAARGARWEKEGLIEDHRRLCKDARNDDERIATVTAWLVVFGEKLHDADFIAQVWENFKLSTNSNRLLTENLLIAERGKDKKLKIRKKVIDLTRLLVVPGKQARVQEGLITSSVNQVSMKK